MGPPRQAVASKQVLDPWFQWQQPQQVGQVACQLLLARKQLHPTPNESVPG